MKRRVLSKTALFHPLLKKKSAKRCHFERYCGSSSSPGRARQGKKKNFLPCFSTLLLSQKVSKRCRHHSPLAEVLTCGLPRGEEA